MSCDKLFYDLKKVIKFNERIWLDYFSDTYMKKINYH